jgi:hypothetical protein
MAPMTDQEDIDTRVRLLEELNEHEKRLARRNWIGLIGMFVFVVVGIPACAVMKQFLG